MTEKKKEAVQAISAKAEEAGAVYSVAELTAASSIFGTTSDTVRAALRRAGKESYTKTEALKIVSAFKNRRVK